MPDSDTQEMPCGVNRKVLYTSFFLPYFSALARGSAGAASLSLFYGVLVKHFPKLKFPKAYKAFR
jgi:hypothetical protein